MASQPLEDLVLDINGQGERINRLYTHLTFCYTQPPSHTTSTTVDALTRGLTRLHESFPWVFGRVKQRPDGLFAVTQPYPVDSGAKAIHFQSRLIVEERPDVSFTDLSGLSFPASHLYEDVLAPCPTLLHESADSDDGVPLFLLKALLVKDGLLLTFAAQHGSMDISGFVEVLRLLSKACNGESFEAEEVQIGDMRRDWWVDSEMRDNGTEVQSGSERDASEPTRAKSAVAPASTRDQRPQAGDLQWALISFSATDLANMKKSATAELSEGFISTDDALSAFVWREVIRAYLSTAAIASTQSTSLSRNVNLRSYLSLPTAYPGFVTGDTSTTLQSSTLLDLPLGEVAQVLRKALNADTLRQQFQTKIDSFHQTDPTTDANPSSAQAPQTKRSPSPAPPPPTNPEPKPIEVRLSSWSASQPPAYDLTFGLNLGPPIAIRRPSFTHGAREGLVYFLPKTRNGDVEVMVCLRRERMERLRQQFSRPGEGVRVDAGSEARWGTWIG